MSRLAFIAAALMLTVLSTAFVYGQSDSKETRDLKGFKKVSFGVPGDLYIRFGPDYSVELKADRDFLEEIETNVTDGRLVIRHDNGFRFNNKKVIINITMPSLEALGVSGSGRAELIDAVKAGSLKLSVSGSGRLYINDAIVDEMECGISGSGDVIINGMGTVNEASIGISGSGNYSGDDLKIGEAEINISGSGSCLCNVTETLEAHVSGSGNVTYIGNPKVDARVSGSGRVRSE